MDRNFLTVNEEAEKLTEDMRDIFHLVMENLMNLGKKARPKIDMETYYFCTRVDRSDVDDWKNLKRVIKWLQKTLNYVKITGCETLDSLFI